MRSSKLRDGCRACPRSCRSIRTPCSISSKIFRASARPPAAKRASDALVGDLRRRIDDVGIREPDYRPRVVCLEWFEPLYVAGHWVPELVTLAGGFDPLGRKGEPSFKIEWQNVHRCKARRDLADAVRLRHAAHGQRIGAAREACNGWNESAGGENRQRLRAQRQRLLQPPRPAPGKRFGNPRADYSSGASWVVIGAD